MIRPQVVELLLRIDNPEELQWGIAGVTVDGQLLDQEERELLAEATSAEVQAVASQLALEIDVKTDLVALHERVAELLRAVGQGDLTVEEALPMMEQDQRQELMELLHRIQDLGLLVGGAKTGIDLAEAYLAGRLVVTEWSPEGEPCGFKEVDNTPERPVPNLAEAVQVLVALVGPEAVEAQLTAAPADWQAAWTRAALTNLVEEVSAEGAASGWLVDNGDGTFSGDTERLADEVSRRLHEHDDEP